MDIKSKKKEMISNMIKQNIVSIVISLLSEGKPITMDNVAAACGVSKGTVYNYFEDRKSLLNHVHKEIITPIVMDRDNLFMSDISPLQKLREFIKSLKATADNTSVYFRFIKNERTVAEEMEDHFNLLTKPLANVIKEGIAKGELIEMDPYVMAEMLSGGWIGIFHLQDIKHEDLPEYQDIEKEFNNVLDIFVSKGDK
ncbi:MAG: TetR/AcrR family transcriptional regulator [Deferribacterales bacterium]